MQTLIQTTIQSDSWVAFAHNALTIQSNNTSLQNIFWETLQGLTWEKAFEHLPSVSLITPTSSIAQVAMSAVSVAAASALAKHSTPAWLAVGAGVLSGVEAKINAAEKTSTARFEVVNPIPDQWVAPGSFLNYEFDIHDVFSHPVTNENLAIHLQQSDGSPVPDWLSLTMSSPLFLGSHYSISGHDVKVKGNLAYVVASSELKILNISHPVNPTVVGSLGTGIYSGREIALAGEYAYIADFWEGLKIVAISNPVNPTLTGSLDTTGYAQGVAVANNYAYIADDNAGLKIMNVNDPESPYLIGSLDPGGTAYDVAVKGSRAYLCNNWGLNIIKVSNPINPVLEGYVSGCKGGVSLQGNYAYTGKDSSLQIIDISDPANPIVIGSLDNESVGAITVAGNYAYVTDGNRLKIIDVSNPTNPFLAESLFISGTPRGLALAGNNVYITGNGITVSIFDARRRQFSAVPIALDVGTYSIDVIAEDSFGATVTDTFQIRVNYIQVANPIPDQTAVAQELFSFTFDENTFNEPQGLSLTYSAGGDEFPAWLSFVTATRTFSGTPMSGDQGSYNVEVTATNTLGQSETESFTITVPNRDPFVQNALVDQNAPINTAFSYTFSENTFADLDGDELSYSTGDLPAWLSFDEVARNFWGTPTPDLQGIYQINVNAEDDFGGSVISSYLLSIPNRSPVLQTSIPDQMAINGEPFTYVLPEEIFVDPDEDPLSYSAVLQDDSQLPSWLNFDDTMRTFSGTPSERANYFVKVNAQDPHGGVANDIFEMVVPNTAPVLVNPLPNQFVEIDDAFHFTVPENTFFDLDNDSLTYSASLQNGSPLPSWLSFNEQSGTFSGTPQERSFYVIEVSSSDGFGGEATTTFDLRVANDAPVLNVPIEDQVAFASDRWDLTLDPNTFVDPDGDTLTYEGKLSGGLALPSWLQFDAGALKFSGTPLSGDQGIYSIEVSASDDVGGMATTTFDLEIPNRSPLVANPLTTQRFFAEQPFVHPIPDNAFEDADMDALIYDAELVGGLPLPSWLNFDAGTHSFSGVIAAQQTDPVFINVIVKDFLQETASSSFELSINYAPVLEGFIENQEGSVDETFLYTFNPNIFSDANGDALTYRAENSNGEPLPPWLTFYPNSQTFLGIPSEDDAGITFVTVVAEDGFGGEASSTFGINIINPVGNNQPPLLTVKIPNQEGRTDEIFDFTFVENTFTDPDGDLLTYSSTLEGGASLPEWLSFSPEFRRYLGVPDVPGQLRISVIADDGSGGVTLDTYSLSIDDSTNFPPAVLNPIENKVAKVGSNFEFTIPTNTFEDANHDPLSYSANGLPKWLIFDPATRAFSGKPGMWDTDTYADRIHRIEVAASDGIASTLTTFSLSVEGESFWELFVKAGAPIFACSSALYAGYRNRAAIWNTLLKSRYITSDEQAFVGTLFEKEIELDSSLIAEVRAFHSGNKKLAGGSLLPDWLRYNSGINKLSGTPQESDVAKLTIRVFGHDERIRKEFKLRVKTAADGDESDEEELPSLMHRLCGKTTKGIQMHSMNKSLLDNNA